MQAALLSIGDELVLGQTVDTNSAYLSAKLAARGIPVLYHQTIADDRPAIREAFRRASRDVELILVSGGLGPTEDDLTRFALADAMEQPLEEDEAGLAALDAFFKDRGRSMPERNRVQALVPRKAESIANSCGTAPGIRAKLGACEVFVMPGVPKEMKAMYAASVAPALDRFGPSARVIRSVKVNTFGQGESHLAERLGELMSRDRNPRVGTTISDGYVAVRVRSEAATAQQAESALRETVGQVRSALGAIVFGQEQTTLQEATVSLLEREGLTLSTAESCTGGLLGGALTDVPGSSEAYLGGWVVYSNGLKTEALGVSEQTIREHGAVSEAVARALAWSAREASGSDLSVAITGVAGPGGGTADKPVGTVWIALTERATEAPTAMRFSFPGDRSAIRDRAVKSAMQMVRLRIMGQPLDALRWGTELRC